MINFKRAKFQASVSWVLKQALSLAPLLLLLGLVGPQGNLQAMYGGGGGGAAAVDHYATLGVAKDVKENRLKAAYRKLWEQRATLANWAEIERAWEILGDSAKRAEYDASLLDPSKRAQAQAEAERKQNNEKLLNAARNCDITQANDILALGASLFNINSTDSSNMTPLILATIGNCKEVVSALISSGADVNISDDSGLTALMHSILFDIRKSALEEQEALVGLRNRINREARLKLGLTSTKDLEDYEERFAKGQMSEAQLRRYQPTAEQLIRLSEEVERRLPAAIAQLRTNAARDNLDIFELLTNASDLNVAPLKNVRGSTPIMYAAVSENSNIEAIIKRLLLRGADINAQNKLGQTALMQAATVQHENTNDIIKWLLMSRKDPATSSQRDGANPNLIDNDGNRAIDLAIQTLERSYSALSKTETLTATPAIIITQNVIKQLAKVTKGGTAAELILETQIASQNCKNKLLDKNLREAERDAEEAFKFAGLAKQAADAAPADYPKAREYAAQAQQLAAEAVQAVLKAGGHVSAAAEAAAAAAGGYTESKGAGKDGAASPSAGAGLSEIARLLQAAELATSAVAAALASGDLKEAEVQAKILEALKKPAADTGDDTGKAKKIVELFKAARKAIDDFKAASPGGAAAGGAAAGSGFGGSGASADSFGGGASSGGGMGGAGAGASSAKPAGSLDDLERALQQLYTAEVTNPLKPIVTAIRQIKEELERLPGTFLDLPPFVAHQTKIIALLNKLKQVTGQLFNDARANYQWSAAALAKFNTVQNNLNGVDANIGRLFRIVADTDTYLDTTEMLVPEVGGLVAILYSIVDRIAADIQKQVGAPHAINISELDRLKRAIQQIRTEWKSYIARELNNAKDLKDKTDQAVLIALSTLQPTMAVNPGYIANLTRYLVDIIGLLQTHATTELSNNLANLDAQIDALRASTSGAAAGGAAAGSGFGGGGASASGAAAGSGFGGGASSGASASTPASRFEQAKRDIKAAFDKDFILDNATQRLVDAGAFFNFFSTTTPPTPITVLRPFIDRLEQLEIAIQRVLATYGHHSGLNAGDQAQIAQLRDTIKNIKDNVVRLYDTAKHTLETPLITQATFAQINRLRDDAYASTRPRADGSTDPEPVTYGKIQAFKQALDAIAGHQAALEANKQAAERLEKTVTADIRKFDNYAWLDINSSSTRPEAQNSRLAWMDLGVRLRDIIKEPYRQLNDLNETYRAHCAPWLVAHPSAGSGAGSGAGGGAAAGSGSSAHDRWKAAGAAAGVGGGGTGAGTGSTGAGSGSGTFASIPMNRKGYTQVLQDYRAAQTAGNQAQVIATLSAIYQGFMTNSKNNAAIIILINSFLTPAVLVPSSETVKNELERLITAAGGTIPVI